MAYVSMTLKISHVFAVIIVVLIYILLGNIVILLEMNNALITVLIFVFMYCCNTVVLTNIFLGKIE